MSCKKVFKGDGVRNHRISIDDATRSHQAVRSGSHLRGFTLIELMITIAIAGLIASMSGPSFKEFLQRSRVNSESEMLLSAINYSRSEAIKRGNNVTLCAGSGLVDGNPCNSTDWASGWVIYSDVTDNRMRSIRILKIQEEPLANVIKADVDKLTFDSSGLPMTKGNFTLCDPSSLTSPISTKISIVGYAKNAKEEVISCS